MKSHPGPLRTHCPSASQDTGASVSQAPYEGPWAHPVQGSRSLRVPVTPVALTASLPRQILRLAAFAPVLQPHSRTRIPAQSPVDDGPRHRLSPILADHSRSFPSCQCHLMSSVPRERRLRGGWRSTGACGLQRLAGVSGLGSRGKVLLWAAPGNRPEMPFTGVSSSAVTQATSSPLPANGFDARPRTQTHIQFFPGFLSFPKLTLFLGTDFSAWMDGAITSAPQALRPRTGDFCVAASVLPPNTKATASERRLSAGEACEGRKPILPSDGAPGAPARLSCPLRSRHALCVLTHRTGAFPASWEEGRGVEVFSAGGGRPV